MLSRYKYAQLAAVASLAVIFGANATMTTASAQGEPVQMEKKQDGQDTRRGDQRRDAGSSRETSTRSDLNVERSRSTTRTELRRDGDRDRSRITLRDRDRNNDRWRNDRWRNDHWRGRHSHASVSFVILGPRHHYRPGWCRGLHRGQHHAPGQGLHAGRHFGLFRC